MTRWILVVEDERPLAEMLCDNLQSEGYGTEWLGRGDEALRRLEHGAFDLLILDIMLPGLDGISVLRELRRRGDRTPVLVLSARSSDQDRIRGLELAADDYLTKPFNLRELLLRVAALLRRSNAPPPGIDLLCFGGNEVDCRSHQARTWDGRAVTLTLSEVRLLRLLWGRDGAVVTRREIVEHLFGPGTPATARTVDNVVLSLRKHFERREGDPAHLRTVRGLGWKLVREPS